MSINLKELDKKFSMELCKVSREVVGVILEDYLKSMSRSYTDIDTMELKIPYYIADRLTFKKIKNPLYDEIKNERLICLNNKEYFVMKVTSSGSSNKEKSVKAFSLEYKLGKIDINVEDIYFQLMVEDVENNIYSLNDYMYKETGWRFGYIDDAVRYDIDENGVKTDKLRMQQSVNMRWYDYLTKNISEEFGCHITFDTYNKLVNLHDINSNNEEIQICLTNDNYLKELQSENSSEEVVTRLLLQGNEEMDIIGSTTTGYPYIENYSYFIDNNEMSSQLTYAINKYEEMVVIRNAQWKQLATDKQNKMSILKTKQDELFVLYAQLNAIKSEKDYFSSKNDEQKVQELNVEYSTKNERKILLEVETKTLNDEITSLQNQINVINSLCKRETATDENGSLIFNQTLLDELKEFVYCDTYNNDAFIKVEDLIKAGERQLNLKCKPTIKYTLSVADFTSRIIDNKFRQHWNGTLSLGNIIALEDDNGNEVLQYFVGFSKDFGSDNGLSLELSDRKDNQNSVRTIGDYLGEARRSIRTINAKQYLLNKVKYNTLNLD